MDDEARRRDLWSTVSDLQSRLAVAESQVVDLKAKAATQEGEIDELKDVLSRGRGALLVIVTLGSLVGFLVGFADKIAKFWK